jgi:periplasmic copper chaperone A
MQAHLSTSLRFGFHGLAAALLAACATMASAQSPAEPSLVQVDGAWARVSVPGQTAGGAYMRLTAPETVRLVGAVSPVAGTVELHEMKMDGDVMRMRAVPALELVAGRTVELKPGGMHFMLQDLKAPLQRGTRLPLTLLFRDARGAERRLELQVPVSAQAPAPAGGLRVPAPAAHEHSHDHKH